MKKFLAICFTACALFLVNLDHPAAQDTNGNPERVQFTEAQKTELAKIQKRILADKKELIGKYVEYGALTQEEADKMISHFEKHYKMMEEHNFQVPQHRPHARHMQK
ncbi:YckD family protein [Peribacillus muralis]|uniref:YckD family protein n=1 Tax=Peribacillus muralis TaxID=264697 RepID=UPI003D025289